MLLPNKTKLINHYTVVHQNVRVIYIYIYIYSSCLFLKKYQYFSKSFFLVTTKSKNVKYDLQHLVDDHLDDSSNDGLNNDPDWKLKSVFNCNTFL